ncbi:ribulose bisphosphate carboxylase small subunit [Oculatella sp. FACHB-28]|uniref:ribulose bisphosphate carboxylase small subunit n=1 Tax=Oculatella sp. FACHB-28 TaxID=2692845 RepID=UPI001681D480|nr:ribulose bisphosphate carboxylase small subunit [Oculatella sp. FACHB-28]MBD2058427.1 ribulose bisphosphate carboxylase small subunit [Oculatella sp. FACHB-28]
MSKYYISPRFLDKLAVHITKNFLNLPGVRVPLILGIHGRKGEGKSFQCELVYERMGIEVVHMSAGELESPDAGDSARLIRLRYREAAELIRVRGKMVALMINDLDAGAGRFDATTQYTVNTQLVNGTLMNIADNPTNVQLPGSYDSTPLHRVPIIVTGNDFSTLYAPLVRDGRMEKFYWEPDRPDRVGIVGGIFAQDGLSQSDIEQLVDTFPNQAIDFFGALRSRLYDEQVRKFIHEVGFDQVSLRVVNSNDRPPEFQKPDFSLPHLKELGNQMVTEQQRVEQMRLGREYLGREYNETRREDQTQLSETSASATRQNWSVSDRPEPTRSTAPSNRYSSNGSGNGSSSSSNSANSSSTYFDPHTSESSRASSYEGSGSGSRLGLEMVQQVRDILRSGQKLGIEFVSDRRFRTNSWQSYATVHGNEAEAIAALEACLNEHDRDYIRLVGIDPNAKQRVLETIIQRPNGRN